MYKLRYPFIYVSCYRLKIASKCRIRNTILPLLIIVKTAAVKPRRDCAKIVILVKWKMEVVLLSSPKYELHRNLMIDTLEEAFPHLRSSSDKERFIFIMRAMTVKLKMLSAIKRIN